MATRNFQIEDQGAFLTFDIPLPVEEGGKVKIQLAKLLKLIIERAHLLSQREATEFIYRDAVQHNVHLVFPASDVYASVKIEVERQLPLWNEGKRRASPNLDLFAVDDLQAQRVVDKAYGALESIRDEVSRLAIVDENDVTDSTQARLQDIANHPNRAMRSLLVNGGDITLNVDGRELQITAPPTCRVLVESETLNLIVRLQPSGAPARTSAFDSKVLQVSGNVPHGLTVGSKISLAFVSGSPTLQACLILAREFDVPVNLQVRLAKGIERQTLLSAEVVAINNLQEILKISQSSILKTSEPPHN